MVDCIIALLVPAAFNKVVCNDVDYSCYDQTKSFLCHRSCTAIYGPLPEQYGP
jgi:hypothetical protein